MEIEQQLFRQALRIVAIYGVVFAAIFATYPVEWFMKRPVRVRKRRKSRWKEL